MFEHVGIVTLIPNVPGGIQYPDNARDQLRGEGSPAADAVLDEPSTSYYGPLDTKDYWSWRSIGITAGIILLVVVVIVAVLFVIPFPHSFSGVANWQNGTQWVTIPQGASVHGSWHSSSGNPVNFQIIDNNNVVIYNVTSLSGSFSFTSTQWSGYDQFSSYEFTTSWATGGAATFSGVFQAPLIWIPQIST